MYTEPPEPQPQPGQTHNLLHKEVKYQVTKTDFGTWRRYLYSTGALFEEFTSHTRIIGLPLLHFTRGKNPETGKRVVAKGIVAVGRIAAGVLAIGQASFGLIAIGQLAIGLGFGLGQLSSGVIAIGQGALGLQFGLGQFTTGFGAIGQIAFGRFVLAQKGYGEKVWSVDRSDPEALEYFNDLVDETPLDGIFDALG